jgi:Na(+)-translocating NADH:ubiquinone oxidoreductase D subunit
MSSADLATQSGWKTVVNGIWRDHPIFSMVLGICSALAVSNTVANALAMGAGVTFVLLATGLLISLLRSLIPGRARMITYMVVIATFVIVVDRVLKAAYPDISRAIGPYVGLIITNCIIMGRAEAFYITNTVRQSILDAVANGFGYTYTLVSIAAVRELLGFGTLLGFRVMPEGWTNWVVMAMAPGAFFLLAIFIWIGRQLAGMEQEDL